MRRLKRILGGIAARFQAHGISQHTARQVLVVDDDPATRSFLRAILETAGYQVTVAGDGPDALVAWEDQGPFDVVVTDVMMPQMRGDELARRIRTIESDIRVLYVTGFSEVLFSETARLREHEALLEKPVTPDGLVEAMALLTSRQPPEKSVWGG